MEITDATILELVKGQATTQQMITDLSNRLLGAPGQVGIIPVMVETHKQLDNRVGSVEKKIWLVTGAAAVLGTIGGWVLRFLFPVQR